MKKTRSFVNRTETLKRRDATIKRLRKEVKYLLRVIDTLEQEKKEDIESLLADKHQEVYDLTSALNVQKDRVERLMRKKWYQFVQVNYNQL